MKASHSVVWVTSRRRDHWTDRCGRIHARRLLRGRGCGGGGCAGARVRLDDDGAGGGCGLAGGVGDNVVDRVRCDLGRVNDDVDRLGSHLYNSTAVSIPKTFVMLMAEASPAGLNPSSIPRPYLFRFAVSRSGSDELPGQYSRTRHVWVVGENEGTTPLVQLSAAVSITTTKVRSEQADHWLPRELAASEATTTRVRPERDEVAVGAITVSRLVTLTEVKGEQADR